MWNPEAGPPFRRRRGRDARRLGDDGQGETGQRGTDRLGEPGLFGLGVVGSLEGNLGHTLARVGCGPGALRVSRVRRKGARHLGEAFGGDTSGRDDPISPRRKTTQFGHHSARAVALLLSMGNRPPHPRQGRSGRGGLADGLVGQVITSSPTCPIAGSVLGCPRACLGTSNGSTVYPPQHRGCRR